MFTQVRKNVHGHRFFIDSQSGDQICICGVSKEMGEKRAKFHNRTAIYNGISFQSELEARYAAELDYRVRAREILKWERQQKLVLKVNGQFIANYYIDFVVYYPDGSREFVETKGYETDTWRMKWRILEATFGDFKQHADDRLTVVKETQVRRYNR